MFGQEWINDKFNNEILILNNKRIFRPTYHEKGVIMVTTNVTASDCLLISTGRTFNLISSYFLKTISFKNLRYTQASRRII